MADIISMNVYSNVMLALFRYIVSLSKWFHDV